MAESREADGELVKIRAVGALPRQFIQVSGLWDPFDPPRWLQWLGIRPRQRD